MTTAFHESAAQRPRFPWILLALTLACAAIAWPLVTSLLNPPHLGDGAPRPAARTASSRQPHLSAVTTAPPPAARAPASTQRPAQPSAGPPTSGPRTPELPPRGEGLSGDHAIQQLLETSWPADLPPAQARQLIAEGRAVLLADLTGQGQSAYPSAFPDAQPAAAAVAPAFSRIRIQAVIVRKGPSPGHAVTHLVWAAADRGGTYTDGRISDITFHRAQGDRWLPQPPTTA